MSHVYIATLGQRPEAITVTLDLLMEHTVYDRAVILHTNPAAPNISKAVADLKPVMSTYMFPTEWREIKHPDGKSISDIDTREAAEDYFSNLYTILREIKNGHNTVDLLISGGRKAMSIYATLAASVLFGANDRVWTVLSPDNLMTQRQFHVRQKDKHKVVLVDLPLVLARFAPGTQPENAETFLAQRRDIRATFLKKLSDEERHVIDVLLKNRYMTNQEIAKLMDKSTRTVENQLHSAYGKLVAYLDYGEKVKDKKRMLLDFLTNVN